MPCVKVIEEFSFDVCDSLADVECGKLERIGRYAFSHCKSLRSINLPSIKIVQKGAFGCCEKLVDVTFGDKLEIINGYAFSDCPSLERIAIPLCNRIIDDNNLFSGRVNLKHVDLIGGVHETIYRRFASRRLEK